MRRTVAGLLTAGVLAAGVLVGAMAANADAPTPFPTASPTGTASPTCSIADYSPHSVTIGLKRTTTTFGVLVDGCNDATYWSLHAPGSHGFASDIGTPSERLTPGSGLTNAMAGVSTVTATVTRPWGSTVRAMPTKFHLLRATKWTSSRAYHHGSNLTWSGYLKIADWNTKKWVAYAGHTISLQYSLDDKKWKVYKRVKTNKSGFVKLDSGGKAATGGHYSAYWRLSYGGTDTAAASWVGDLFHYSGPILP